MPAIAIDLADLRPAVRCDVCDGSDFGTLTRLRSPRMINLSLPVAICRNCGFVTLRPRPTGATYERINDAWFSETFSTDDPGTSDDAKKFRKWSLMWERIGGAYPAGPSHLLDVGAGQGWAIEYLRRKYPTMQATAIERWEPCRIYIRDRLGATVFDVDLDAPWPEELRGRFDLVILRHTLEHLTEPRQALENIAAALAPGGAAYIVVPNALRIRAGMAMRTDFFRPVHLHYFNEHTFRRITERAGLTPRSFAAESELWGLFGRAEAGTRDGAARNTHDEQRSLLTRRLAESAWQDRRTIARAYLRHAARVATSLAKSLRTGSRATT